MRPIRCFLPSILLAVSVCGFAAAEEGPHWEANLEVAKRIAAQSNRLVLVHFWAPWCGPCMRLEGGVFAQPGVGPAMEARFVPVKINVQDFSTTSRLYGVETIPCDIIMTPSGRVLYKLHCPQDPRQYVGQLNQAAAAATGAIAGGPGEAPQFASIAAPSVPATSPGGNVLRPQPGASPPSSANLTLDPATSASDDAPAASNPPANPFSAPPAQKPRATAVASDAGGTMTASYRPSTPGLNPNSPSAGQPLGPAARSNGQPQLGLDGFCPVTLIERSQAAPNDPRAWQHGDSRWGAVHRGVTYLFVGPEEQKRFLQHPDRFAPALSGNDPVLAFDKGQLHEGRREFGALSDGRMYLFVDEDDFNLFKRDPKRYEQQVWRAENPQPAAMR